jgi:hypothetical protein
MFKHALRKKFQRLFLAGSRVRQISAGGAPDVTDGSTGTNEKGGRCESDESQKQSVLDQILALFFSD